MSLVPAHYELINEVSDLVKSISPETILIINGDVKSLDHGLELYSKYRLDGVMIGRAIFGKPWFFTSKKLNIGVEEDRNLEEKLRIMLEHTKLFDLKLGEVKSFAIMKKHFKAYINGFSGAKELRESLYNCNDSSEVEEVVNKFLESNQFKV
jgi:tRNA-dihydrouridine synthase